ncbi:MAG: cytochrome B6 [Planctomycetaceae bacterium]|nr:cytochrome B6 [Planctomycetaceae bacterium]
MKTSQSKKSRQLLFVATATLPVVMLFGFLRQAEAQQNRLPPIRQAAQPQTTQPQTTAAGQPVFRQPAIADPANATPNVTQGTPGTTGALNDVMTSPRPVQAPSSVVSEPRGATSYSPVDITEPFETRMKRMSQEKAGVEQKHGQLLKERYDLSNRPAQGVATTRGKAIQEGVRVKLPQGVSSWEQLANMSPEEIKQQGLWPQGFLPLPFPNHPVGGMLFPQFHIDKINQQDKRDLTRFDLDYDLPDYFLPEYPPAIFLTTRPDLGDVSQGQVVTQKNYFALFNGILNPKQLEGLRLLVTPFPQQQFNSTEDRNSAEPSLGVTCFDCHVNGHTNASTHLVGDIRPQAFRHRLDTPSLRGVNIQRIFGSQRGLKSVEDFTEFEQRAAYFDGDPVIATKKGVNVLERGSQVHFMAEFEALLDFPPAPKLDVFGKLDPKKANEAELRGEAVFNGRGRCAECHPAPYYTDNSMHNMQTIRFFEPQEHNGHAAVSDGPIKTFPLRGLKDSAPYWHDGRLLTIEDTVEIHNLLLGTKLTAEEKQDLTQFLRCL